ncbi:MAG: insulinase family protein [Acholeplasmatales bacterium]|jgi:predicted Zn-dependent peptidase|nr:insulinase family protein [Acholeplasmatales bacterium]
MNSIFKTYHIVYSFSYSLDDKLFFIYSNLLENIINYGTSKMSKEEFNMKQLSLYSTNIVLTKGRIGNLLFYKFILNIIDPKIVGDESLFLDSINLFNDFIFNRDNLTSEVFENVKNNYINIIKTNMYDTSSLVRYEQTYNLWKDTYPILLIEDEIERIKNITKEDIINYYKFIMSSYTKTLEYDGAFTTKEKHILVKRFKEYEYTSLYPYLKPNFKNFKEIVTSNDTSQTFIFLSYYIDTSKEYIQDLALSVASIILGGNFSSILIQTIREKYNLAYSISSNYDKYSGILSIRAGVDNSRDGFAYEKIKEIVSLFVKEGTSNKSLIHHAFRDILDSYDNLDDQQYKITSNLYNKKYLLDRKNKKEILEYKKIIDNDFIKKTLSNITPVLFMISKGTKNE